MRTYDFSPLFRSTIGFDRLFDLVETAQRATDEGYSPFVNLTAEHDFVGSGRILITTQVTTPLLSVLTPIDGRSQTYGKVAAGVAGMTMDKVRRRRRRRHPRRPNFGHRVGRSHMTEQSKVFSGSGGGTGLTSEKRSPNTVHWTHDVCACGRGLGKAVRAGHGQL